MIFTLSDAVTIEPATVSDVGSDVLANFCHMPKNQTSDFRVQQKVVFSEPMLEVGGAGIEASKVVAEWFWRG